MTSSTVVIVGGSLAGCTTAIALAKAGVDSLLIDKSVFPRRKACGEGLSARGQEELLSLGFDVRSQCATYAKLCGYRIASFGRQYSLSDSAGLLGLQRTQLDASLLAFAASVPLVSARLGEPVRSIVRSEPGFDILSGGETIKAQFLVVADGGSSGSLLRLGHRVKRQNTRRLGSSSAWRVTSGHLAPYVLTFVEKGGEIYLTPTGGSSLNISILGTAKFVSRMSEPGALTEWTCKRVDVIGATVESEGDPIGAGPLNSCRHGASVGGAFIVGDACETFDPIGGMGMTHAVVSGRLAAQAIVQAIK